MLSLSLLFSASRTITAAGFLTVELLCVLLLLLLLLFLVVVVVVVIVYERVYNAISKLFHSFLIYLLSVIDAINNMHYRFTNGEFLIEEKDYNVLRPRLVSTNFLSSIASSSRQK